jgi:hypothetical protein
MSTRSVITVCKIVGNEIAKDENDDESDPESTTKKQKLNNGQTSIRSFYKNKELEKGYYMKLIVQ